MAKYMNKFNLDALSDDGSSPEDSNDSEDAQSAVSTVFDKEGDKRCSVFNFSSPVTDESIERESQFLKKRRVDRSHSKKQKSIFSGDHSKKQKTNCAGDHMTPTRVSKHVAVHRSVRSSRKSGALSKKYPSPSTSSSPDSYISSTPDTHSSSGDQVDIDHEPPTEIQENGISNLDHDRPSTESEENGALNLDHDVASAESEDTGTPNLEDDHVLPTESQEERNSNLDDNEEPKLPNDKPQNENGPANLKVFAMLKNISNVLDTLVERVKTTESEIKYVKAKLTTSSSSSDSGVKRVEVPLVVRSETRKVYKTLVDDDDNDFNGFDIGPGTSISDTFNQQVVKRLIKEVQALNKQFSAHHIRNAAYTYYKTLSQEDSLTRRGKATARKLTRKHRERIRRKFQERLAVFQKCSFSEKDKAKWQKVLQLEMMSSEESGTESSDEIYVKALPWRASRVERFMRLLDDKSLETKSAQSKRQMKKRVISKDISVRQKPQGKFPSWAFV